MQIAILGGGLSGAVAAIQLLREIRTPFELAIVEPNAQLGRGVAYGRAEPFHLLNVRAGKLGVLSGEPNDFAAWARQRSREQRTEPGQSDSSRAFLPRRLFGRYVEERLRVEIAKRPDVEVEHLRSLATRVRQTHSGFEISLDDRSPLGAHILLIATGYGHTPRGSRWTKGPFTYLDPDEVRAAKTALFLGTGLSFVDEFLRLQSYGFRGSVLAVSRRGLLPEAHRANERPTCLALAAAADLSERIRAFRSIMKSAESPAAEAVNLILGMREEIQSLWQALDVRQQRTFLDRIRPYWNVARHRLPPEIHVQLRLAMERGILRVAPGRILDPPHAPRVAVSGGIEGPFDLAFDCTGFRPDMASPLMRSLIGQGLAMPDAHQLGLAVSQDGSIKSRVDVTRGRLFALGPLGYGSLFEITAVPEIVAQSGAMAKTIAKAMVASDTQVSADVDRRVRRERRRWA